MFVGEAVVGNSALVVEFEAVIDDVSFVDGDKQVLSDGTIDWEGFDGDDRDDVCCKLEFTT